MSHSHVSDETSPLISHHTPSQISSEHNARGADHPISRNAVSRAAISPGHSLPSPRNTAFRVVAAMYSFVVLGLFTSTLGVMLPHLSQYYHLTDIYVSFIFLVGPVGYVLAAQLNDSIHLRLGQRGIASLGPLFHFLSATAIAMHPSFLGILAACAIASFGIGLLDASWCAWAGDMGDNANTVSGMLHGSFSVGAAAGPFLAGTLMDAGKPWWNWYYVLAGASLVETIVLPLAFRLEDAATYRRSKHASTAHSHDNTSVDSKAIFKHRATWISSAYFLAYVGTESAISGWIVTFMARARQSTPYLASLSSSGFWAGMAIGRLALGVVTDNIGVRRATTTYLLCAISLELLFATNETPVISAVLMMLLGFCMGPLFPSGVVMLTRLLPMELHVAAVSFVASVGQIGGALLPFGIGAMVQGLGIQAFKYVVFAQSVVALMIWVAFPTRQTGNVALLAEAG